MIRTMSTRAAAVRWPFLAGLVGLLVATRAQAQTPPCDVDTDCPGTECGTEVCVKSSGLAMCYPANTQGASGISDGRCDVNGVEVNANCKCAAQGAICSGFFCSFTVPQGGTGGSTGAGGSGTGTGGSGTGGSSTGTAGTGGGGDGGCSLAGAPSLGGAAGLLLLAAALLHRRPRRRA